MTTPTYTMQLWHRRAAAAPVLVQAEQVTDRATGADIATRCRRLFDDAGDWWVTLTPNVTGPGGGRGPFGQQAWLATFTDSGQLGVWMPTTTTKVP